MVTILGLEEGKECVLVGTLYKHMKLKPGILDEYAKVVSGLLRNGLLIFSFLSIVMMF